MPHVFGTLALLDLHVHTRWGSECAELLDPQRLPEAMGRIGLDGIVITEHNTLWPEEELTRLNHGLRDRRIYGGIEVSTATHHFVVIGLDTTAGIWEGMAADSLWRITRAQDAAMILAHPLNGHGIADAKSALTALPVTIDAVELASTVTQPREEDWIRKWGLKNGIHRVAGSDAHCIENLGQAVTAFPRLPVNEKELAQMIRSGLGRPLRRSQTRRKPIPC